MITKIKKTKVEAVELKLNESSSKPLNEGIQIGDTVRLDKEKGYVIGQVEGKWIIQVQGNTHLVDPKQVKEWVKKPNLITVPHMKFDEKTQALLFEQFIRCGVYMGNVPVKLNDCYVKYSDWEKASPEQKIKVLIEGNTSFIQKSQIKIFEDINDFANPDNYVPGVIVDETTEEVVENILVHAIDYTDAIGDADPVRIIRKTSDGEQERQTMPRAILRTLTV
jgi:hypothetical protein